VKLFKPGATPVGEHPHLPTLVVQTALINTLVAVLLTLTGGRSDSFADMMLFSQCIGLSVLACTQLLGRWRPLQRLRGRALPVMLGLAVPLGVVLGYGLAFVLRGEPQRALHLASRPSVPVLVSLGISAVVAYVFIMRHRLATEAAARSEAQRLASDAELRLLRAQLEPHMLFNTLANLRSLIDDEPVQAKAMLDQLITYLRGALAASRTERVTLRQECAQLRAYLDIMAVRMGRRLQFDISLPEALADRLVPPMLLQPLVENAIRHGIEPQVGGGRIDISAAATPHGLVVTVADTGRGLRAGGAPPDGSHYGLSHVRERLRALYGPAATLELLPNDPQGTLAIVTLP
jgi:hypothetical protein